MDTTTLQNTVNTLTTQVETDKTTLANDESALATASSELDQVKLINQIEALTTDEVTTINEALKTDPQNTTGITLTLPVAAAPAP